MTRLELSSKTRTDYRKSETKRIRREGGIPATVYGKGEESASVIIDAVELNELLKTPGSRLSLIDLKIDGKGSKAHPVLIQDIQRDPVSKNIIHLDFHKVSMDEPVHAAVPIFLIGEAPGVKLGGILEQFMSDVNVKALPDHIPTHIDVDVSNLEMGHSIHLADIKMPEGVEVLSTHTENVVVTVRVPSAAPEEEAAEAPAEAAATAPEAGAAS